MGSQNKYIWGSSGYVTEDYAARMAENNWGVTITPNRCLMLSVDAFLNGGDDALVTPSVAHEGLEVRLEILEATKVPLNLWIACICSPDPTIGHTDINYQTPTSYYEQYRAVIEYLDDNWSNVVKSYWYEDGYPIFAEWFRELTDITIRRGIYRANWTTRTRATGTTSDIVTSEGTPGKWFDYADEVSIEIWTVGETTDLIEAVSYIRQNIPAMSLAIDSMPFLPPTQNPKGIWCLGIPGALCNEEVMPTVDESKRRYRTCIWQLKQAAGTFDVLHAEISGYDEDGNVPATSEAVLQNRVSQGEFQDQSNWLTLVTEAELTNIAY